MIDLNVSAIIWLSRSLFNLLSGFRGDIIMSWKQAKSICGFYAPAELMPPWHTWYSGFKHDKFLATSFSDSFDTAITAQNLWVYNCLKAECETAKWRAELSLCDQNPTLMENERFSLFCQPLDLKVGRHRSVFKVDNGME